MPAPQPTTPPAPTPEPKPVKPVGWQEKVRQFSQKVGQSLKTAYLALPLKTQKLIKISGLILGGLFALMIVLVVVSKILSRPQKSFVVPTPSPGATPEATIENPSAYATDSAVLEIEADIDQLQTEINQGFDDPRLLPPELDFEINFE